MAEIQSKPYLPDPQQCCEACVFGPWTGVHAVHCEKFVMLPCCLCRKAMPVLRAALGYYSDCGMQCVACSREYREAA